MRTMSDCPSFVTISIGGVTLLTVNYVLKESYFEHRRHNVQSQQAELLQPDTGHLTLLFKGNLEFITL